MCLTCYNINVTQYNTKGIKMPIVFLNFFVFLLFDHQKRRFIRRKFESDYQFSVVVNEHFIRHVAGNKFLRRSFLPVSYRRYAVALGAVE